MHIKSIGKYLKGKYGAKIVKDKNGVSWWEVDVKPEEGKAPIEAFGMAAAPSLASLINSDNKK